MVDEESLKKTANNLHKTGDGFLKGSKVFEALRGKNLKLKFQNSSKFSVLEKVGESRKFKDVFRFDKAHKGAKFNHLNLGRKYFLTKKVTTATGKVKKVRYDPHFKLSPSEMAAGNATAKACRWINQANKVLVPIAIAIDTCRLGFAGYKDWQYKTSRNFVEMAANIAGGYVGGYGGAIGGAAVGSAFFPGFGTIVGGILGAVTGGITGSVTSGVVVNTIGNAVEYNIEESVCEICTEPFKARKYKGEKYCEQCTKKLSLKQE